MDTATIIQIITAIFGGSGAITYVLAYKERKNKRTLDEISITASVQSVYRTLTADTNAKLEEMRQEIADLKDIINNNPPACPTCPNIKKTP